MSIFSQVDRPRIKPIEWIGSAHEHLVYVLHVFQKKSTHGVATPKREIAVTIGRWQRARAHHAANYEGRSY